MYYVSQIIIAVNVILMYHVCGVFQATYRVRSTLAADGHIVDDDPAAMGSHQVAGNHGLVTNRAYDNGRSTDTTETELPRAELTHFIKQISNKMSISNKFVVHRQKTTLPKHRGGFRREHNMLLKQNARHKRDTQTYETQTILPQAGERTMAQIAPVSSQLTPELSHVTVSHPVVTVPSSRNITDLRSEPQYRWNR